MSKETEYEGPPFVAHDETGKDYILTPVYRCRTDAAGRPIGDGYEERDLLRLWTATGEVVRRDASGRYTLLSSRPQGEITLVSNHPKAV